MLIYNSDRSVSLLDCAMGGISSVPTDGGSSVYLRNGQRFSVARLEVLSPTCEAEVVETGVKSPSNSELKAKPVLAVEANGSQSGLSVSSLDEDYLVEFVQVSI